MIEASLAYDGDQHFLITLKKIVTNRAYTKIKIQVAVVADEQVTSFVNCDQLGGRQVRQMLDGLFRDQEAVAPFRIVSWTLPARPLVGVILPENDFLGCYLAFDEPDISEQAMAEIFLAYFAGNFWPDRKPAEVIRYITDQLPTTA